MTTDTHPYLKSIQAGLVYFIGVFALGFALGAIRLMLLVPTLGELLAVIVETPVILAACWLLCRRAIVRLQVPGSASARLLMGITAFALLMIAEFGLATLMFAETPAEYLAGFSSAAGLLGLLGQIVYGLFPLLQLRFPGEQ